VASQRYLASTYAAGGANNPSGIGYATIRSLVSSGTDVVHTTSSVEELYTVNVSDGDELYHINILGEVINSTNGNIRFRFVFPSSYGFNSDFNLDAVTPQITISRHGISAEAGITGVYGNHEPYNALKIFYHTTDPMDETLDVLVERFEERWFMATFNF
jgi:hypothetical protein